MKSFCLTFFLFIGWALTSGAHTLTPLSLTEAHAQERREVKQVYIPKDVADVQNWEKQAGPFDFLLNWKFWVIFVGVLAAAFGFFVKVALKDKR